MNRTEYILTEVFSKVTLLKRLMRSRQRINADNNNNNNKLFIILSGEKHLLTANNKPG
jgi:hypothetical protein